MNNQPDPSPQRLDEWLRIDQRALAYHESQWKEPKEMTKAFAGFIQDVILPGSYAIDLGCGTGAATYFLARSFPHTRWVGYDVSTELLETARDMTVRLAIENLSFVHADWYSLKKHEVQPDIVVSMQTLSWLPDAREPLIQIFSKL